MQEDGGGMTQFLVSPTVVCCFFFKPAHFLC